MPFYDDLVDHCKLLSGMTDTTEIFGKDNVLLKKVYDQLVEQISIRRKTTLIYKRTRAWLKAAQPQITTALEKLNCGHDLEVYLDQKDFDANVQDQWAHPDERDKTTTMICIPDKVVMFWEASRAVEEWLQESKSVFCCVGTATHLYTPKSTYLVICRLRERKVVS